MPTNRRRPMFAAAILLTTLGAMTTAARAEWPYSWGPSAPVPPLEVRQRYDPAAKYDSIDAADEAYGRRELERREAIERQLQTIQDMRWYGGLPTDPLYYRDPPSLETIYATGVPRLAWRERRGLRRWGYGYAYPYPYVFEPWPLVGGDIFGYPFDNPVRQPRGLEIIWTGPSSYIARPIYESAEPGVPSPEPEETPEPLPVPPPEPAPEPAPAPPMTGPIEL